MPQKDTLILAFLALIGLLVARALYLSPPRAVADASAGCKPGGFLRMGCTKGCQKVAGKCVPAGSAGPSPPPPPPTGPNGHALMRKRSVQSCLAAADAFEAAAATEDGAAAARSNLLAADALNCNTRGGH